MRLAVLKERRPAETRVAATPETVKKFIALGCSVAVETGAGLASGIPDAEYAAAGAEVAPDAAAALNGAGIVLKIRAPLGTGEGAVDELSLIPRGALLLVSDLPMTPEGVKTERSDRSVTERFVDLHLDIGIKAMAEIGAKGEAIKHYTF